MLASAVRRVSCGTGFNSRKACFSAKAAAPTDTYTKFRTSYVEQMKKFKTKVYDEL